MTQPTFVRLRPCDDGSDPSSRTQQTIWICQYCIGKLQRLTEEELD